MYRSDVVGSLLRPAYLKEARQRHEAGELTDAAFKRIEDRAERRRVLATPVSAVRVFLPARKLLEVLAPPARCAHRRAHHEEEDDGSDDQEQEHSAPSVFASARPA